MGFEKGNQSARGGPRAGAGRKKKASTLLREKFLKAQHREAQYAFGLLVKTLHDGRKEIELRVKCAELVMDRVYGKPKQAIALGMDEGGGSGFSVTFYKPDA
jgi:hypothetical protein